MSGFLRHTLVYSQLAPLSQLRAGFDRLRNPGCFPFEPVVVGKIGDDLRMDYSALGHTANLAARMEQIAEPGRIYLAEPTAKLIEGFFVLRDLGRHEVRGLSQPVGVFELEGVGRMRTRLEVSRARSRAARVPRPSMSSPNPECCTARRIRLMWRAVTPGSLPPGST